MGEVIAWSSTSRLATLELLARSKAARVTLCRCRSMSVRLSPRI